MSPQQIANQIRRALGNVRSAFRAVLGQLDSGKPVQLANIDGLAGEPLPGIEVFQQFGITSTMPPGTTVIALPLGGRTSASVIVASEHAAYRLKLTAAGEVAIYNQDGDHVWIKRNGQIVIKASVQVAIDAPLVTALHDLAVGGNVTVGGNLTAAGAITDMAAAGGQSMQGMRDTYNGHHHGTSPTPDASM
jgi:phage baseplate assembly protein V